LTKDAELDARQLDALGIVHDRLRQLIVAVVGCGGTGSPIAEQLVRMGVSVVILIDSKLLSTPSNVRRVFGSRLWDLNPADPRPKVKVVGDHLDGIGLDTKVRRIHGDVRCEDVFRILLDADVVICGTDTHGSRAVVNELASTYMMPVIDLGVRVGSKKNGDLTGLLAEVRILTPTTPCLWCRGTINADVIRAENLPDDERRKLEREGYVVRGIGEPAPSVTALTVMGSGLATSALLALLSESGESAPSGYWVDGFLGDSSEVGLETPAPNCRCRKRIGLGDSAPIPFLMSTQAEEVSAAERP
jgi:molybdopterin/thiamine biosynthesis adenylyltransferase